ncbi:DegT/DnrJ/EryC1/StrS family aminotransferase [Citricoccus sp. SGAir0253]|uniref:DegT/DnrJ/EryC1/StrS family aminotransferase n=1 Tax=Citricoccus sp. SGAir0253 TaxID=2567881 RepID=UPI0010CCC713|nr:DegT/DnrJ/EryC1/StrS family aminotransferase [Citricoccus sp. SGAir0253]QCU78623.1 DegT/DnrJ/EryC1/StrS family aminotransferase [Citricoccus sp. SGAir0253]
MRPWLGRGETDAVIRVMDSGWMAQGPRTAEFERAFAAAQGVSLGVAMSSGTAALHVALLVAGVQPGDDVIVPSLSFVATSNAVTYVGARPVFADVDLETGTVTAATVDEVITPRTTAIVAVDQGGLPVDLAPLRELCDRHSLALVEDAAGSAGSTYRGRPVGAGADITAWSFDARAVLTTGEGGMLTTDNPGWAARARRLREHSMDPSSPEPLAQALPPRERYPEIGFSYRMTDLQAAVGLVQLGKLPEMVRRRRALAADYRDVFASVAGLRLVRDPQYGTSNVQSCWVEVLPEFPLDREELLEWLSADGISARRGIMAVHLQDAYAGHSGRVRPLPVTERLAGSTIVLPVFHTMTAEEHVRVCASLLAAAEAPRRRPDPHGS